MNNIHLKIIQEISAAAQTNKTLSLEDVSKTADIPEIDVKIFLTNVVEDIDSERIYNYIKKMLDDKNANR